MWSCGPLTCDEDAEDNILSDGGELLVEELLGLKYLNALTIDLKCYHALQSFLSFHKFESCSQSLQLRSFDDSKSIGILCLANLQHLSLLEIGDCKILEELKIGNIGEIQKAPQPQAFHRLKEVVIKEVTWLAFSLNLRILGIFHCSDMEEVIRVGKLVEGLEISVNLNPFPKLRHLMLYKLPNLKSIYCKALPFQNLDQIDIEKCPELKKLPLDSDSAKQRKIEIIGEEDWWKKLQWEDEATQNAFLPLFTARE